MLGGKLSLGVPPSAWARRSIEARLAEGRNSPPRSATRSPARNSRLATARTKRSARSDFRGKAGEERQSIEARESRQSQTLCAAAHSISRKYSRSDFADCRQ